MADGKNGSIAYLKDGASLSNAAIIGFDLDHCLARYTRPALTHLIFKCLVDYLVPERGWPATLLTADPRPDLNCKGILFETSSGNLLRLDQHGRVVQGFHGTQRLTSSQLQSAYGSQPWQDFERLRNMERHENFLLFLTYFDMPAASLLAHMVDAVDGGWTPPPDVGESAVAAHSTDPADGHNTPTDEAAKTAAAAAAAAQGYGHLIPDLFRSFNHVFDNVDGFTPRRGGFFSALQDEPEKYLLQRPGLKAWLQARQSRGQHTFLATNSCLAFAHFLLQRIFGEDWKTCFDLIVMDARKGAWFNLQAPWLLPDAEGERGGDIAQEATWPSDQVFVNGSAQLVDLFYDLNASSPGSASAGGPSVYKLSASGHAVSGGGAASQELPQEQQRHEHTVTESLVDAMEDAPPQGGIAHKARPGVWYAGDHLHGDVAAASQHGWNTIAVVEELAYCRPGGDAASQAGLAPLQVPAPADGGALTACEATSRSAQLVEAASSCGAAWGTNWFEFPQEVTAGSDSVPYYAEFSLHKATLLVSDVADVTRADSPGK